MYDKTTLLTQEVKSIDDHQHRGNLHIYELMMPQDFTAEKALPFQGCSENPTVPRPMVGNHRSSPCFNEDQAFRRSICGGAEPLPVGGQSQNV